MSDRMTGDPEYDRTDGTAGARTVTDPTALVGDKADALLRQAGPTLVIDTSLRADGPLVGHKPLHIADSRAHVEKLTPAVSQVLGQEGLTPSDVRTVVAAGRGVHRSACGDRGRQGARRATGARARSARMCWACEPPGRRVRRM